MTISRRGIALGLILVLVSTAALTSTAGAAPIAEVAQRYVVLTSSSGAAGTASTDAKAAGAVITNRYTKVFPGFSALMTPAEARAVAATSGVISVTPDQPTRISTTQAGAPWGLDRVDQMFRPLNGTYTYDTAGAGVTVFVVDSGIRLSHGQFAGRARSGYDFVDRDSDASDCHGHGTHVAGTIGGSTYGVAKGVRYVSLRVWGCDGGGTFSDMIAALDWALAHRPAGPAVVNISGGGGAFDPLDQAVRRTVVAGIPVVVAGMNNSDDACNYSPAREPSAITIGATDATDTRASFSSFGTCIDLFAPGVDIRSAVNTSDTATASWSGTSMATPHVTGIVARVLQRDPLTARSMETDLRSGAIHGVVRDAQGAPNLLAFSGTDPNFLPPTRPQLFKWSKNDAAKTATMTWSIPASNGGSPVTGYRVSRDGTDSKGVGAWSAILPATARSHSFVNLRAGSRYNLTVEALTKYYVGEPSSGAISMARPPGAPAGFTESKNDAAKTAQMTWQPPASNGGSAITGYLVARDGTDSTGVGPWSVKVAPTARSQTFVNLRAGAAYNLTVRAINAVGTGPAAGGKVTMALAPSVPTSVKASKNDAAKTATLTWLAPTSDGGRSITGYRVARDGTDSKGVGPWSTTLTAAQRSHTFVNLKPGSSYNFTVRAVNVAGIGTAGAARVTMAP